MNQEQTATVINDPMGEIRMSMLRTKIDRIVKDVVAQNVSHVLDQAIENAKDALGDIEASLEAAVTDAVSDAVSDARRSLEVDDSEMDEVYDQVTEDLMRELKKEGVGGLSEDAQAQEMTDEERYAPLRPALERGDLMPVYMSAFMRPPRPEEIHEILNYIAENHEPTMAMFYWNYLRKAV